MAKKIFFICLFTCSLYRLLAQSCTPVATITPAGTVAICDGSSTTLAAPASDVWTQKTNFGGVARYGAVAFSIGAKGYIGTGRDGSRRNDFWEYNPATNAWTQKVNFASTTRYFASGFSIGTKGYIGTGGDISGRRNDFWEYNPATNIWTAKANFGGGNRDNATSFSIGAKGYIGTGYDGTVYKSDFWEYDPATNSWTQKANFGGGVRAAAKGFSIGSKGYMGTGYDGAEKKDFWEYDPATNTWTQKLDFGGVAREGAAAFSIGNYGYIGTGWDGASQLEDLWEYSQATDTWTQKANFGGGLRELGVGFSIGAKGYIGTGWHDLSSTYKKDFWEYDPGYSYSWSSGQSTQTISASALGNYTVTITNILGCSNTSSPTSIIFSNTWAGGGTNDWNTASNWSCGTVPNNSNVDAVILNSAVPMPVLNSDINIHNITLNGSATVSLNNHTLGINAGIIGSGTLSGSAASGLTLNSNTGNLSFTSGATILKDLLLNTGASATLSSTLQITAGGTPGSVTVGTGAILNTGGNLVLQSDASGTARIGNSAGTITGDVTVERFMPARRSWRLLTVPVTPTASTTISQAWQDGQAAATIPPPAYTAQSGTLITTSTMAANGYDKGTTNNPSLKYYNGGSWLAPAATTIAANSYPGYMLFVRGDRNFVIGNSNVPPVTTILKPKGPVNTGTQTINNTVGTGFQVVGNPFASAINFHSITRTGTGDTYYLWDPAIGGAFGTGGFVTFAWNSSNGNYDMTLSGPGTSSLPNDGTIESGAAFLVNFTGAGNLQIKETDKISSSSSLPFGRPQIPRNTGANLRASLGIIQADSSVAVLDAALVTYGNEYTNNVTGEDAIKLNGFSENIALQNSGKKLAIERRKPAASTDTVAYYLSQLKRRNYILDITASNLQQPGLYCLLEDQYTGDNTVVDLNATTKYAFTVSDDSGSYATNRLRLVYKRFSGTPQDFYFTTIGVNSSNTGNIINWQVNNANFPGTFFIEHSFDGNHFSTIASISNYTDVINNRIYTHTGILGSVHFYRIRFQIYTGETKYSSIVQTNSNAATDAGFTVNPNPVSGRQFNLCFNNFEKGNYNLVLADQKGAVVYKSAISIEKGNSIKLTTINNKIAAGFYTAILSDNGINGNLKKALKTQIYFLQ